MNCGRLKVSGGSDDQSDRGRAFIREPGEAPRRRRSIASKGHGQLSVNGQFSASVAMSTEGIPKKTPKGPPRHQPLASISAMR